MSFMEIARPRAQAFAPPSPSRTRPRLHLLLFSLLSAALLWLSYFPVAWGWVAWVALVPLLALVRTPVRPWLAYLFAWIGNLAFGVAVLQWLRVADWRMNFTWIGLSIYCSLFFLLAFYLIRFLDRRTRLPLVLAFPIAWTAVEFFRSTFMGGFAWYLLSHTQHDVLPLVQIADVTGAYGVSFLVAAVNALLFEILWSRFGTPRWSRRSLLLQGLAVGAALVGTTAYGYWRLGQDRLTPGPRIALVQGNLDQRISNDSAFDEDAADQMKRHYVGLSDLAARYKPDLIVWPETSNPDTWLLNADGTIREVSREIARRMAERWKTNLLIGQNAASVQDGKIVRRYNSAIFIERDGVAAGRYDKIHRVPFGEFVPFRELLPWMDKLAPYDFDYSVWPGQEHVRFPLVETERAPRTTFGVLICYEDTDAEVARPYVSAKPVDFLLNVSNDGWFDGTSEHDQHLAICRFRAVECRRSVARSVNMGISAIIDSNGRVLRPLELPRPGGPVDPDFHVWDAAWQQGSDQSLPCGQWSAYKKVAGVLLAVIPLDNRVSLYASWGDWLPWSCWLLVGGVIVFALARPKAKIQAVMP